MLLSTSNIFCFEFNIWKRFLSYRGMRFWPNAMNLGLCFGYHPGCKPEPDVVIIPAKHRWTTRLQKDRNSFFLQMIKIMERAVSKRVLILRSWSLIRTFLAFGVLIYISGSLFSLFWLHSRELSHICRHWFRFTLLANFDFYLCLRINFHTSSFWVLILAAGGPYWVLISQKMGPYWVPISKLGGPY